MALVFYPNNLTLTNLVSFLPLPTLIYQPSYPRSTRFRGRWVLWCGPATACTCTTGSGGLESGAFGCCEGCCEGWRQSFRL